MAITALPWSFYRAHRRLNDKSKQNRLRLKNENANNYDKSKQNTMKTRYTNKHSFPTYASKLDSCLPICRSSSSKMLQTLFTSFLEDRPSSFCWHGFNFENKHTTDEDFVLLCKRTSYTPSAQCERHESAVKAL